ncbi:nucleotidyltransferase family protein [candidate division KSB1 bacterium]|nr:nucleotidyltransferase family protein [candidate division KSB1 bacterium]
MNLAAVILAAGEGKRLQMLGPKAFLKLNNGKTFIENIYLNIFQANLKPIIIVANAQNYKQIVKLNFEARILINHRPVDGMLSSIILAIQELENQCQGFLLHPVDFPLVRLETILELKIEFNRQPNQIIQPVYSERNGHPVIFPAATFESLKKASQLAGARSVIHANPEIRRVISVDDPGVLLNINTPEIYLQHCRNDC